MGLPIVIAANGYGQPITEASNGIGIPVEIATNGYGMPVVIVASGGMPVVGSGGGGPDVTAPLAAGFSPEDNETDVALATDLVVIFNEAVSLGAGSVTLKRSSDNVTIEAWNVATEAGTGAGQVSVVSGSQLTMRLTSPLAGGVQYYVIWDAGVVKDAALNNVAAQVSTTTWSFTTFAPDVAAPTVVSFDPEDGTTEVDVDLLPAVVFNETVVLGSGTISLKRTLDDVTADSWDVTTDEGSGPGECNTVGTLLSLFLTSNLANNTEYYIVWDAGVVEDASGNPVAAQASTTAWSFATAVAPDVTAPTVASFFPPDNDTDVYIDTVLSVEFDETIVLGTGTISLKRTSDNVTIESWSVATEEGSGPGQVEAVDDSIALYPASNLAISTQYYVIWDAGVVEDISGNPVAAQASTTLWSFTTGTETAPSGGTNFYWLGF